MNLNAFLSTPAVRDSYIARLRRHVVEKCLIPGPLAWDGTRGSLVGCLLESEDLAGWEKELGLPQWLATTADGLAAEQQSIEAAAAFGVELLTAITPGADASRAGSAVILSVLDDACQFVAQLEVVPAELKHALEQVQTLHRRSLADARPSSAEWRAARRTATAITDSLSSELLQSLAVCIETAGWDPISSNAVVFDTLRVYSKAAISRANVESGFTEADDANIRAHLQIMWDTYLTETPELQEQGITVFSLLEEHFPKVAEKIRSKNELDHSAAINANRRAADVLIAQLKLV